MASVIEMYYQKLFDLFLVNGTRKIEVKSDFHGQMEQINYILNNDPTGLITTVLEYMVHSATIDINFNAKNPKLTKVLTNWKENVNKDLNIDTPRGLRSFTEQFFRERWKSSFITANLIWGKIDGFEVPIDMYIMDGASIYVKNDEKKLDTNRYYFGNPKNKKAKSLSNSENRSIIVRKPYNQHYDTYPVPYLVRKGTIFHALLKRQILNTQTEVLQTALPYQMLIKVGSQDAIKRGLGPTQEDLDNIVEKYQNKKKDFDEHVYSKGLAGAFAGDVNLQEIIPDYARVLDEKLIKSTDRNILSSLGLVELKGFSSNREESILNPKVLVEEVEDAVQDYVEFLKEVVNQIKERNSSKYTVNDVVEVQPGVIKTFLTDEMKTLIRSWYDRGLVGQKSGLENTTGLDYETQIREREYETKNGLHKKLYPRITQNMEKDPADLTPQDENVPDDKKKNTPESKNYKNASNWITCLNCDEILDYTSYSEKGMGYISCPHCGVNIDQEGNFYQAEYEYIEAPYNTNQDLPDLVKKVLPNHAQSIFRNAFNSAIKQGKDETTAFKIAWGAVRNAGYRKGKDGKYHKIKK